MTLERYSSANAPEHPRSGAHGSINEHVLIAEKALGHYLPAQAEVHHVNGDKRNNLNTNLVICEDHSYHRYLHMRQRIVDAGGDPDVQKVCSLCKELKLRKKFNYHPRNADRQQTACRKCIKEYNRKRRLLKAKFLER